MGKLAALLAGIGLAACGGASATQVEIPDPPAPDTRATLVGPRCTGGAACECRDPDQAVEEDRPSAPFKRFEVRVGPIQNDLWVTVDDMVLYKSRERATECFYIDLLPGKHPVRVQARGEDGFGALVRIHELSGGGPWWYDTFEFDCGSGGLCDKDGLDRWRQSLRRFSRNVHDPCGSVKIRNIDWRTGRMPDALHPADIVLDLVLDVYEFETRHPPGSKECKGN